MNLVKLSTVFLVLVEGMCLAKIIVNSKNPKGYAVLEEAAINILTNCYKNQDKTILFSGNFPSSFVAKLALHRAFSLVTLDDRNRIMKNTDYSTGYHRNTQHKVHIIVILISNYERYNDILTSLKSSRYYNTMAFVLIIGWSSERRYAGCDGSIDTVNLLFNLNYNQILNANLLCDHHAMGTVLYGSNPFASWAPKPWRSVANLEIPTGPNFYWFVRKYHENEDMCKNLDYKKTQNLGGFMIKLIHSCHKPYCSREASVNVTTSRRVKIYNEKRFFFMAAFIAYVNATVADVYEEFVLGANTIDTRYFRVQPLMLRLAGELFFTYPHGTECMFLISKFRGNKSQLQKIISVIDGHSWIGLVIVYFVTLSFFKYFFRQPLMDAILNIVRLSSNLGLTTVPRNVAPQIYMACLLTFVVTMQGIFVGNLAALLTQDSPVRQVDSVQDLADLGYKVITPPSFFGLFEEYLPKDRIVSLTNNEQCVNYVVSYPSIACLDADIGLRDIAANYSLHFSECIQIVYVTNIMPHYWALEEVLNKFLGVLISGGILMPLYYIVDEKRLLEAESQVGDPEPRILTLNDLAFAFAILGIGLACSFVTFVIEIMIYRYHRRVRTTRVLFLN